MDPFVKLVKDMRTAQTLWFKFHDKKYLKEAVKLEQKVDSMINNYNVIEVTPPEQRSLFQDDEVRF